MKEPNEQEQLRKYVLGEIGDEPRSLIEEHIMTDDDYFQKLAMIEEDLIQEYVDGNLEPADRVSFEKRFLHSAENRQKVKFARALRKYVSETGDLPEPKKKPSFFDSLKAFFTSPVPATFAVLIILGIGGFFIWKSFSSSNDSEILIALNKAYKDARPTESRITGFNYAPKIEGTRGNDQNDTLDLLFAKSRALEEVRKKETAGNSHELGRVFLAENNFDEAIKQFEKAIKQDPDNAKLHNDLGAALMEKAKTLEEGKLETLTKANEEFERAIKLDKSLLDAYFNRALCLQIQGFLLQAKGAWQEYLELDSSSRWAVEAKDHLRELETQTSKDLSANELEAEFLNLYTQRNNEEAWRIVSQNRELITEKYLPQRLAMSFLDAPVEERKNKIEILRYLGNLEKSRIEDFYASDVADFYENASEENIEIAKKAQRAIKNGYRLLHEDNFSEALKEFDFARTSFLQIGNFAEANSICLHFIGYIFYFTNKRKEAVENFAQVNDFCRQKKYRWLYLMNFIWLIGGQDRLGYRPTTNIKKDYEEALKGSENINDSYMTQKFLLNLAWRSSFVKQEKTTLNYLQKLFTVSNQPYISLRQKFRNFNTSIEMLPAEKFTSLSKSLVLESVSLAEESKDILFIIDSQINTAIVHTKTKDFTEAENWLKKAQKNIENIQEKAQKNEVLAKLFLEWGHLEREKTNFQEATGFYDKAINILETTGTPTSLYETKKSRLLAYQELGDDQEVEKQLPSILELAEKNRDLILDEQERHSFFDNEQTIYDIAIEHEIRKDEKEKAFDYAESSNSRSLLDWLQKGANVIADKQKTEILFNESVKPLSINEIREKMPSEVQILQYTVLKNKTLIWLISKEKLIVIPSETDLDKLEELVKFYLSLIQSKDAEKQIEAQNVSLQLFQILVAPILSELDENKEICLVPNKFLFHLPFAALVFTDGHYFLEKFKIFYSPSSNVFLICTKNARNKSSFETEKVLSIGNPAFDRKDFSDLKDLPFAKDEAEEISRYYFDSKKLLEKEATRKAFQSNYKDFEVIHFAGHYVVQPDSPLRSKLILAKDSESEENFLTNADLMADRFTKTKLVVLSACQTGVEGYYNGEGLIGLSRTFLATGVPLIVASQWQVDSETTTEIMKKFHYYRRQEKLSTANALRRAQLNMRYEQNGKFQSPYYWAAFATFGGYTEF